jgi:methionyl aminopeptidase
MKVTEKIFALGARPAFPPQIALNDIAAHFLPQPDEDIVFTNEVIKLDVGICYNGAIGDCAVTVDLSGKYQSLLDAVESALLSAEQSIHVGQPVREIGKIIEGKISSYGFKPAWSRIL